MNIALIGFRSTGKTTIARLLTRSLGKKLISTDEEIEKSTKSSLEKLMKKYGKDKLQDIESEVIERLSDFDECVFDTSENVIMRNENVINLKRNALIVLLTADTRTILSRLKSKDNPHIERLKNVQECDERYKRAADYIIDTSKLSPEEACDLITHYIQMEIQ